MSRASQNGRVILASKSPRRRDLLEQAGLDFSVIPADFDENDVAFSDPETYVKTLAEAKAGEVSRKHPESWVIGADTIVMIDGKLLEKPVSVQDARNMMNLLSGKWHTVFTGFCARRHAPRRLFSATAATRVRFKTLSRQEVEWYIHTEEPFDKAGGYAIQGLGTRLVREIKGSYTNVVGLPVCEVMDRLTREDVVRPGPFAPPRRSLS